MSKKLGLALGSGGARGVAHIGLLKALEEEGIKPNFISGTSMGAVVGACYAVGMTVEEMKGIISELKPLDIIDVSVSGIGKLGLLRSKKVQNLLLKHIGEATFDSLNIPFTCTACDLLSGKLYVFNEGSVALAVQASSAIPSVFRPVDYNNMLLVDGGVICRVPIAEVKEMGADVVIACDVLVNTELEVERPKNLLTSTLRIFDIMDNKITHLTYEKLKDKCDLLLLPEMKGMNQYAVRDLERAYEEGYQTAKQNMDKIKSLLG